jgi:plasmid stability protein
MGQLLIRNVPDAEIAELKVQAERENISLEQRLRNLVADAASQEHDAFWALAAKMREATRGKSVDIRAAIDDGREERDRAILGHF